MGSDAVKVAADFLGLAVSDVLFSIGSSSFSGNAAAMQYGVQRVPATGRPALRREDMLEVIEGLRGALR